MARGRGRPKHIRSEETAQLVELGVSQGCPHLELAKVLGIGIHTLKREYPQELAVSHIKAKLKMGGRLFNAGMAGNVKAMVHWLALRGGLEWRPPALRHQHSGPEGGPIPVASAIANITHEEAMKAYRQLCQGED